MALSSGARLGPYVIEAGLGAGGMGEVYRARDTRLGREVAVKILHPRLGGTPDAVLRFEREARAVAAISHPSILAIHDVGEQDGVVYSVMELLEGETLRDRLSREKLAWLRAAEIAAEIAEGLAAAHGRGVVHRDLKPENVFVTSAGRVRILDFGLAALRPATADLENAATATWDLDSPGAVMGTPGYMAPEQVRGEPGDVRSDVFALGAVLYEMLAGRRAFPGGTAAERLASVLSSVPEEIGTFRGDVPHALVRIVERCLEKSPDERFQSAQDLAYALREVSMARDPAPARPARHRATRAAVVAASVLLVIAGAAALRGRRGGTGGGDGTGEPRSLAVLPLRNLSGDPAQDVLADGLTEDLIGTLARVDSLRVTSRTSVMAVRDMKDATLPSIGRRLGVDSVIEGAVSRSGDQVKVSARLVDVRTDRQIWGETYERPLRDVFSLESEIAEAVMQSVRARLTSRDTGRLRGARPVDPAAYEAYLKGRHAWNHRDPESLRLARREFQASLDADPLFAPAWAGLADVWAQLAYGNVEGPQDAFPKAREAAARALEIDAGLGEAHASLGFVLMYFAWDFPAAEAEFGKAIALNPGYAPARSWHAYLLTALGRTDEALRRSSEARRLDPLSPAACTDAGWMLHYAGRDAEALRALDEALELDPGFPYAHFWKGRIETLQGRFTEAEAEFAKVEALRTWQPMMSTLGYLYAVSGRRTEALSVASGFGTLRRDGRYASPYAEAAIWAGLGETEKVLSLLGEAYGERSHWLIWLRRDPRWRSVRSDPRFRALAAKVGLPE